MKIRLKYILYILLMVLPSMVSAQYLGFTFGIGNSTATGGNDVISGTGGINEQFIGVFGFSYEQILNEKSSICTGIFLKGKGFYYETNSEYTEGWMNPAYISVPLTYDYKFRLTNQVRYYLGAGGFYDYANNSWNDAPINEHQFGIVAKTGFEIYNLKLGVIMDQSLSANSVFGEKLRAIYFSLEYRFGGAPRYYHSWVETSNL